MKDPATTSIFIFAASMAGGFMSLLVFWLRQSGRLHPVKGPRIAAVVAGTAACGASLFLFGKALGAESLLFAATVTIMMAAWVAVMNAAVTLPLPKPICRPTAREARILRRRWTGVPMFGRLLRSTPLRHLGGNVYLRNAQQQPAEVLRGIDEAMAVHLWAIVVCVPWMLYWVAAGRWRCIAVSAAIHVILNVYPMLHLRVARGRVGRYVARLQSQHQRD